MSIACKYCERRVSLLAVEGREILQSGWIARHASRCPRCSGILRDFAALARGLNSLAEPSPDPATFRTAVTERVALHSGLSSRAEWRLRPAVVLAASAAILAVMLFPRFRATDSAESVIRPAPAAVASLTDTKPEAPRIAAPRPAKIKSKRVPAKTEGKAVRKRRIRIRRAVRMAAAAPVTSVPVAKPVAAQEKVTTRTASIDWGRVGAWYESVGYPRAAVAAYSKAYEAEPAPGLAYCAGRAAESAGDISAAVEFYARALETQQAENEESDSEKGTPICTEQRSSV